MLIPEIEEPSVGIHASPYKTPEIAKTYNGGKPFLGRRPQGRERHVMAYCVHIRECSVFPANFNKAVQFGMVTLKGPAT